MHVVLRARILLILLATSTGVRAAPFFGGPTYSSTTQTGYLIYFPPYNPGSVAGNGKAVGNTSKREAGEDLGDRAFSWGPSGLVELENLGSTGGSYMKTRAYAINPAGVAIGYSTKYISHQNFGTRAVRWDTSGEITELDGLGTDSNGVTSGSAYAINDAGTIVGGVSKYVGNVKVGSAAVRWDASGTAVTELGGIGTSKSGIAVAINKSGTAIGWVGSFQPDVELGVRAVRWDGSGTTATELGHLGVDSDGFTNSHAYAINDAGTVAGQVNKYLVDGRHAGVRAVRWDAGSTVATELGHLGTDRFDYTTTNVWAIDSKGTAVGQARKHVSHVDMGPRAVRWNANETVATELGTLGTDNDGYTSGQAYGINSHGIAVGTYAAYNQSGIYLSPRAVAWGEDGVAIDLNTLLSPMDAATWNLVSAYDISDTYWITGYGAFDPDGAGGEQAYSRLFLLDAITLVGTPGDATRDNVVNFDDLLILAQNYNATSARWDDGDFNGDEVVAFDDLLSLAQHYGFGTVDLTTSDFAADWAIAQSLVPEPSGLLGLVLLAGVGRRRS